MDLKSEGEPDVGMETLTWIHTHKTAALLKASVASGAILAGATDAQVAKCEEYALKIGLAFQVHATQHGLGGTSTPLSSVARTCLFAHEAQWCCPCPDAGRR